LRGRRLREFACARGDLRWPLPVGALRALRGRALLGVERRAKYLLLRFSGRGAPVALAHLGMTGRLFVEPVSGAAGRRRAVADPSTSRPREVAGGRARRGSVGRSLDQDPTWRRHEHWRMDFGDRVLRYVDARRFGMLDVIGADRIGRHRLLAGIGREPFGRDFDADWLHAATRRRKCSRKAFLMDSRRVAGIGNIYASEACFRAGLHPRHAAGRLTRADCSRLVKAVRAVLRAALREGGTTLRDYAGVDEESGWFQRRLMVYGKDGTPCRRCGATIRKAVDSGRATYWCPGCSR
jgi:formamidopyrimidine-DNA glycosylase